MLSAKTPPPSSNIPEVLYSPDPTPNGSRNTTNRRKTLYRWRQINVHQHWHQPWDKPSWRMYWIIPQRTSNLLPHQGSKEALKLDMHNNIFEFGDCFFSNWVAVQWEHRLPASTRQYITRTTREINYSLNIKRIYYSLKIRLQNVWYLDTVWRPKRLEKLQIKPTVWYSGMGSGRTHYECYISRLYDLYQQIS